MYKVAVWFAVAVIFCACAEAVPKYREEVDGPDAAEQESGPDGSVSSGPADAAPAMPGRADAAPPPPPPVDAAPPPPPPPPDAAPGGGLFCTTNADCPAPDDCCFVALCVIGIELGDACLPTE